MDGTKRPSSRIRREEFPLVVSMFAYFFLVITTFWILKPIKKGLFVNYYLSRDATFDFLGLSFAPADAELIAKVSNMLVAFVAVVVFTRLSRSLRRQQLAFAFSGFALVCFVIYSLLLGEAGEVITWSFYLFGDLYNTLMVATFFAFLNDSVTPGDAKRLYGPIILGGVSGGAFGSMFVRAQVDQLAPGQWMWVCAALTVIVIMVAKFAGHIVDRDEPPAPEPAAESAPAPEKRNAAIEGALLVAKSKYLMAIVVMVGLYEMVSTLLDYQFTQTVLHFVDGDPTSTFSTVFAITNTIALLVQLLLTSVIMNRLGVRVALLIMPVVILASSALFLVVPVLWVGSMLSSSDNALSYSVNQSAREALYTPTSRDEKYKAKAFIDMFVQRGAKALAVGLGLGIGALTGGDFESLRWLSLVSMLLLVGWLAAAAYAGSQFRSITQDS